jgi:hypothetical protein
VFDELATRDAMDGDALDRNPLPIWRDTEDCPLESGPGGNAGHDLIAFGDLIINGMPCIREGSPQ